MSEQKKVVIEDEDDLPVPVKIKKVVIEDEDDLPVPVKIKKVVIEDEDDLPNIPEWYLIPEIDINDFLELIKPFFEQKKLKDIYEDPFLKCLHPIPDKDIRERKGYEMKLGKFHEALLGRFNGWEQLDTGVDVRKKDGTVYIECKNKYNTCNAGGLKSTHEKLRKLKKEGRCKRAILCQINCPNGKVRSSYSNEDTEVMNGQEVYELVSGRKDFYEDLLSTFRYIFEKFPMKNYSSYKELKNSLICSAMK